MQANDEYSRRTISLHWLRVFTHDDTRGHRRRRSTRIDEQDLALVADLAARLVGTPRHLSVHSGGILITAQPLVEVVPLERATKEGIVVTQWNKDSVEDAGLIKIDLLCLRTLDLVSEAERVDRLAHGRRSRRSTR